MPTGQFDRTRFKKIKTVQRATGVPPEVLQTYIEAAIEYLKNKPSEAGRPQTDDELHAWFVETLGVNMPRTSVCVNHVAPFQFIADLFFHRQSNALVLANRGGGKTQALAALHVANGFFKPGFTTTHFGAIQEQAKRAYVYFKNYTNKKPLSTAIKESLQSRTDWINKSSIEILAGTERQTQGAHSRLVSFDELESGNPVAYANSLAIPTEWQDTGGEYILGQYVATSTRNTGTGLMSKALSNAEENGTPIYAWCILETALPCGVECAAENCNLFRWSEGRTRNATGWLTHEAVNKFHATVSEDNWAAQFLCLRPETKSYIYSVFGDNNISEEAEYKKDNAGIWLAGDWGFTDSTALLLCQYRDGQLFVFDELVGGGVSEQEWTERLVQRITELPDYDGFNIEQWKQVWKTNDWTSVRFPNVWIDIGAIDPSAVQLRNELKIRGLAAAKPSKVKHKVISGQDIVRAMLQPGPLGKPRLVIHPRCVTTIQSFQKLRSEAKADGTFGERPDPSADNHKWSHCTDALRYLVWLTRKRFGLGGLDEAD